MRKIIFLLFITVGLMPNHASSQMTSVSLRVQDNGGSGYTLYFGFHPSATFCVDSFLGEIGLPPLPPTGAFDARWVNPRGFVSSCFDQGTNTDYRPYTGSSQVDTFKLNLQPGTAGYPITLSWQSISSIFTGPVRLTDIYGLNIINVDMKNQTTYVLTSTTITSLFIITEGPVLENYPPIATTIKADYITDNSATLYGSVNPLGIPAIAWFEWGPDTLYGFTTPPESTCGCIYDFPISHSIHDLSPNHIYHYRIIATNGFGTSYGRDRNFTTAFSLTFPPYVSSLPATNITVFSATLNGYVIPNSNYAIARFEWGRDTSYGNFTPDISIGDLLPRVPIHAGISNLLPFTVYHYRVIASNVAGTSFGNDMVFRTDSVIINIPAGIPLLIIDSEINYADLRFGVHPQATYCIDTDLGESYLPPPPAAGYFDARFINPQGYQSSCFGEGTKIDLRPYFNDAQIDTYALRIQTALNGYPINMLWPNLNTFYQGPVRLIYRYINELPSEVDMKSVNNFTFGPFLASLMIIAEGPVGRIIPDTSSSPSIISVKDIPHDQGGFVSVEWKASKLDTNVNILPYYSIWRSLPANGKLKYAAARIKSANTISINGVEYYWEWIANAPAHRFPTYSYTAPTLYDSTSLTSGKHYFLVSAQTDEPNIFYDSNIDSGYSVDNLPPSPPRNATISQQGGSIIVHWNPNTEVDFYRYEIYSSTNSGIYWNLIGTTADTFYTLSGIYLSNSIEIIIRALDIHENRSEINSDFIIRLTSVTDTPNFPTSFRLYQNFPNPFNASTIIKYEIPQNSNITIKIFSMLGQEVLTLLNRNVAPGIWELHWQTGQLPSGIYLLRMNAITLDGSGAPYTETKRLILLK